MQTGDTVYWKGKPAKIFGTHSEDLKLRHIYIMMLNGRKHPGIYHVSITLKHLKLPDKAQTTYADLRGKRDESHHYQLLSTAL